METDLIVNLPKVKSHSLTKLTASVKNLYGAVPGYSKTTLHRRYPKPSVFGRLLKAIWKVLPPSVSIADGIVGMEGQGPANGRPISLGFLAAALLHKLADLLGDAVPLCTEVFDLLLDLAVSLIERQRFVHEGQLLVLEFLSDILTDCIRIFTNKLDVQHGDLLVF